MAKRVTKTKSTSLKTTETTKQNLNIIPGGKLNNFLNNYSGKIMNLKSSKNFYIILVIIGILLLAFFKKSFFVAAIVNGMPITNLELQMELNKQFKTQTLNQLVDEKIILDEARKNGVVPTEIEVDTKIAELEKTVGGKEVFDNLISQQGQTRANIRDRFKIQLAISKMYDKEASVSAEEVSQFLAENSQALSATDSAGQQKEAFETIKNQKLSQIFNQKFQELKNKAKIQLF